MSDDERARRETARMLHADLARNDNNPPANAEAPDRGEDDETHAAIARTLISFLETDYPGTRWFELGDGEEPPADAVAVRRFVATENPD
jgi:hypothetical protein